LYFYNYLKTSLRDINPKWGLFFDIEYSDTPFEDENFGTIFKMGARLFTRGILNHHSIKLSGETRKQNPKRYLFGGNLEFPRGYNKLFAGDNLSVLCEEMQTFSSEYTMPLLYPDFRIGSLIYLTRLRAILFYDYATGSKIREIDLVDNSIIDFIELKNYYSYGAELYGDFFLARMPLFPISAGIRYSYVPERNTSQIEFLLEINLSRY